MSNETWQDSFRNALKSVKQINEFFELNLPELPYDILIPTTLALRIKEQGLEGVLAKQFLPSAMEIESSQAEGLKDPIGDQKYSRPGQIIHRYPNRVLFLPTTVCPVVCRYCFRKNELSTKDEIFKADFEKTMSYLKEHPEIEEVIFSGGDPLMLSNNKLSFYLEEFSTIEHIKYIRLHTRAPASLPNRIDSDLLGILDTYAGKFETLSIGIHINHEDEIDADVERGIKSLSSLNSLNLLSQTVLLKDINDDAEILEKLFKKINKLGVRPYYLHHPDQVQGGMHYQIDIPSGRIIFATLRKKLPGWLIPQYVLDIPEGHGKTPLYNPESIDFSGELIGLNQEVVKL
jgi:lysine 2,3-aminomutase